MTKRPRRVSGYLTLPPSQNYTTQTSQKCRCNDHLITVSDHRRQQIKRARAPMNHTLHTRRHCAITSLTPRAEPQKHLPNPVPWLPSTSHQEQSKPEHRYIGSNQRDDSKRKRPCNGKSHIQSATAHKLPVW